MCEIASDADRRRLYMALRLRADVHRNGMVRLSGIFDPDLYLLDVLKDAPDATPRPEVPEGRRPLVYLYNTPR